MVGMKIGENGYLTWGDFNNINFKLNAALLTILAWVLMQAWSAYQKSKDKTSETLIELVRAVERIEERLKETPTHDEVNDKIRDELLYAKELNEGR